MGSRPVGAQRRVDRKSDRHHHRPDRGPGGRLHRRLQEVGYLQEDRRRRPARYRGGGQVDVEQRHQARVRGVHGWHQGGWQGRPVALEQRLRRCSSSSSAVSRCCWRWAKMLRALSHVPGFWMGQGWADAMDKAAGKARDLQRAIEGSSRTRRSPSRSAPSAPATTARAVHVTPARQARCSSAGAGPRPVTDSPPAAAIWAR